LRPASLSRSLIGPTCERAHQADLRRRTPAHHRADRGVGYFSRSMPPQPPMPGCGPGRSGAGEPLSMSPVAVQRLRSARRSAVLHGGEACV